MKTRNKNKKEVKRHSDINRLKKKNIRSRYYLIIAILSIIFIGVLIYLAFTWEEGQIRKDSVMNTDEILRNLLSTNKLKKLRNEVAQAYGVSKIDFEISPTLEDHGAFDPDSLTPKIILNLNTGLNASNIAHELIHAIQIKKGYPTVRKGIFNDRRQKVIRELNSNILHIPLVKILKDKGFNIKDYLKPTLTEVEKTFSERTDEEIKQMPIIRIHYEASVYLRINYETISLPRKEKDYFIQLFKSKSPIAMALGKELVEKIDQANPYTPKGNTVALYESLLLLNEKNLSEHAPDFSLNLYTPCIQIMQQQYQAFLTN